MIWNSTIVMTLFDVAIIAMSAAGLTLLIRHRDNANPVTSGLFLAVSGMFLLGSTYLLDLGSMWLLPLFIPRPDAMSFMRDLHLNFSWLANSIAIGLLYIGMITLVRRLYASVKTSDESKVRYRSLFEHVPLSIWEEDFSEVLRYLEGLGFREIEDFDGYLREHPEVVKDCASLVKVLAVNEGAVRLHEVKSKDELLSDISNMFTEESYSAFKLQLQCLQRGELKSRFHTLLNTAKGSRRDVILQWQVAPGNEKSLSRVFVTMTDITDRVRDQKALQELNVNLEKLVVDRTEEVTAAAQEINRWFEMSSDMICILGTDGHIKKLNRAWELTLGYSTEELLAKSLIDLVHPDDRETSIESRAKVVSLSDRMSNNTSRYRHKDGSYRWLAWSAQYDPELKLTYAIARDVTKEMDAVDSQRSERQVLEHLVAERTVELGAANEVLKHEVIERKRSENAAEKHALQQETLAGMGRSALAYERIDDVLDDIIECLASCLGVEYAKVLQLLPSGESLLLRAGVGWRNGLVGNAKVSTERESQAGFTLITDSVVIVDDLRSEGRFNSPPILTEHDVVSGMSVIIRGRDRPFGILGVHTSTQRAFTQSEAHFVEGVANILADAIERSTTEAELRKNADKLVRSNAELLGLNRLAVGRELRMVELKRQVNFLLAKSGAEPVYDISFAPAARLSNGDDDPATTVQT